MGLKKQPDIRSYWRSSVPFYDCKVIWLIMSRQRFEAILTCLHLVDRDVIIEQPGEPGYDNIVHTRWLLETITENFRCHYNSHEFVCCDEMMVPYLGRYCRIKQYMPLKPMKHSIKLRSLCDNVIKFCYNLEVYLGGADDDNDEECGALGQDVVSRLVRGLEGKHYVVVTDNYFTSPALYKDLLAKGLYAIRTVHSRRAGFPSSLNFGDDLPRGTLHVRMHRDRHLAAIHWSDSPGDLKGVCLLSSAADPVAYSGTTVKRWEGRSYNGIPASPMVVMYNKHMGGVDAHDQLRGYYSCQIWTKKWWHLHYFFALILLW